MRYISSYWNHRCFLYNLTCTWLSYWLKCFWFLQNRTPDLHYPANRRCLVLLGKKMPASEKRDKHDKFLLVKNRMTNTANFTSENHCMQWDTNSILPIIVYNNVLYIIVNIRLSNPHPLKMIKITSYIIIPLK